MRIDGRVVDVHHAAVRAGNVLSFPLGRTSAHASGRSAARPSAGARPKRRKLL